MLLLISILWVSPLPIKTIIRIASTLIGTVKTEPTEEPRLLATPVGNWKGKQGDGKAEGGSKGDVKAGGKGGVKGARKSKGKGPGKSKGKGQNKGEGEGKGKGKCKDKGKGEDTGEGKCLGGGKGKCEGEGKGEGGGNDGNVEGNGVGKSEHKGKGKYEGKGVDKSEDKGKGKYVGKGGSKGQGSGQGKFGKGAKGKGATGKDNGAKDNYKGGDKGAGKCDETATASDEEQGGANKRKCPDSKEKLSPEHKVHARDPVHQAMSTDAAILCMVSNNSKTKRRPGKNLNVWPELPKRLVDSPTKSSPDAAERPARKVLKASDSVAPRILFADLQPMEDDSQSPSHLDAPPVSPDAQSPSHLDAPSVSPDLGGTANFLEPDMANGGTGSLAIAGMGQDVGVGATGSQVQGAGMGATDSKVEGAATDSKVEGAQDVGVGATGSQVQVAGMGATDSKVEGAATDSKVEGAGLGPTESEDQGVGDGATYSQVEAPPVEPPKPAKAAQLPQQAAPSVQPPQSVEPPQLPQPPATQLQPTPAAAKAAPSASGNKEPAPPQVIAGGASTAGVAKGPTKAPYKIDPALVQQVVDASCPKDIDVKQRNKLYAAMGRAAQSDAVPPTALARYTQDRQDPTKMFTLLQEWVKDPCWGTVQVREEHIRIRFQICVELNSFGAHNVS